uniref:Uncharacterized protein n=1 Tax=viral metagenome TaxID=1070528 RepID=A0A6C0IX41_9ZZZZ
MFTLTPIFVESFSDSNNLLNVCNRSAFTIMCESKIQGGRRGMNMEQLRMVQREKKVNVTAGLTSPVVVCRPNNGNADELQKRISEETFTRLVDGESFFRVEIFNSSGKLCTQKDLVTLQRVETSVPAHEIFIFRLQLHLLSSQFNNDKFSIRINVNYERGEHFIRPFEVQWFYVTSRPMKRELPPPPQEKKQKLCENSTLFSRALRDSIVREIQANVQSIVRQTVQDTLRESIQEIVEEVFRNNIIPEVKGVLDEAVDDVVESFNGLREDMLETHSSPLRGKSIFFD